MKLLDLAEALINKLALKADHTAEAEALAAAISLERAQPWEPVGICGVDAGMLLIGDPCYFLTGERSEAHTKYGGDWSKSLQDFYANGLHTEGVNAAQLSYVKGHAGLGVVVDVDGDGTYTVMGRRRPNGFLKEIRIRCS